MDDSGVQGRTLAQNIHWKVISIEMVFKAMQQPNSPSEEMKMEKRGRLRTSPWGHSDIQRSGRGEIRKEIQTQQPVKQEENQASVWCSGSQRQCIQKREVSSYIKFKAVSYIKAADRPRNTSSENITTQLSSMELAQGQELAQGLDIGAREKGRRENEAQRSKERKPQLA